MNNIQMKIIDIWKISQLTDQQNAWKNSNGELSILSWILIGIAIFILAVSLIICLVKFVLEKIISTIEATIKFIWTKFIWWWFKWLLLIIIILLILIFITQGFGVWLGDPPGYWWIFRWMGNLPK